ncbi:MAG TPA: serine hydrolase [Holophaga sp.]|nr:serine hydrolase [Holophaga sp.]
MVPALLRTPLLLLAAGVLAWAGTPRAPRLHAAKGVVLDQRTGEVLLAKQADEAVPVASLTKLVSAMVLLDAQVGLEESLTILEEDKDTLRHSKSRLPVGTRLTRREALTLALMASENRAAHALGRTFPGGLGAFVAAMNAKARALGLATARFQDPAGLSSGNVASAKEMARIVDAAAHYPLVKACSTRERLEVQGRRGPIPFHNTNALLASRHWHIGLSKTGFIEESGPCLALQAQVAQRPLLIILLDAGGAHARFDDAERIRTWVEGPAPVAARRGRARRKA